mmetsp:Transcript_20898/g.43035  ORF Transcript_20898/g.43035 Transcript_20898/m.43035 type:complete len:81 (+) Transcript_20898:62-304(+)
MFFSPSFLAAAKLFALTFVVTSIPAAVHAQGAVEGFEYVGVGYCRDESLALATTQCDVVLANLRLPNANSSTQLSKWNLM